MYTARLIALLGLALSAQSALASTIWLKDKSGNVCYNSSSSNTGGFIGLGGINADGSGFTMTISNPTGGTVTPTTGECTTIPKSDTNLVFTSGVTPVNEPISRIGTGSSDTGQCLDQGTNLEGVQGTSTVVSGTTNWSLAFATGSTTGCKPGTFYSPTPLQRTVSLAKKAGPANTVIYSGYFYIFNANTVPEPSSILLLLPGALGLSLIGLQRRRRVATLLG